MERGYHNSWPALLACCFAGLCLWQGPREVQRRVQQGLRDALAPGQFVSCRLSQWVEQGIERGAGMSFGPHMTAPPSDLLRQVRSLEIANRRLAARNATLAQELAEQRRNAGPATAAIVTSSPLLSWDLVEARILGAVPAKGWRQHRYIGAGAADGLRETDLVLQDDRPLLDVGTDHLVAHQQPVISGRTVIGRVREAGRWTSTLELVTDAGFRAEAQLARPGDAELRFLAEGTLRGDGSGRCWLDRLWHTSAVSVGDEVYTHGRDGWPEPLYFGRVVEVELDAGASEWKVRVEPGLDPRAITHVAVLRSSMNRARQLAN